MASTESEMSPNPKPPAYFLSSDALRDSPLHLEGLEMGLDEHGLGSFEESMRSTSKVVHSEERTDGLLQKISVSPFRSEEHNAQFATDTRATEASLNSQSGQQQRTQPQAKQAFHSLSYGESAHPQYPQASSGLAEVNGGEITSQPALLPFNRDFHDSSSPQTPRLNTAFDTLQPRLENHNNSYTITNITEEQQQQQQQLRIALIQEQQLVDSSNQRDTNRALERPNMGYSYNQNEATSWRVPLSNSSASDQSNKPDSILLSAPNHQAMDHERKERDDDDSSTIRTTNSATPLTSPLQEPLLGPPIIETHNTIHNEHQSAATTPTTVSTAPSTNDDISLGALDPLALERLALLGEPLEQSNAIFQQHRRGPSWETPSYQSHLYVQDEADHGTFGRSVLPPPQSAVTSPNAWGNPGVSQQRIASFRNEYQYNAASNAAQENPQRWHVQQPQQIPRQQHQQPSPRQEGQGPFGAAQRPGHALYGPFHGGPSRSGHAAHMSAATPPRTVRNPRTPPNPGPHRPLPASASSSQPSHSQSGPASSGNPRSPSEVLKTLLRKKACLYEPDTSRAVALATWLVGRELALAFGYFSRQQLQAGVHACVASKIDSGVITRTKVNRCMQIILNSCFHYIIPRPDGTEENGDAFCRVFANEVADDMRMLQQLPAPWNDLSVDRNVVLEASSVDLETGKPGKLGTLSAPTTPQSSPHLGSMPAEKSSPKGKEDGDADNKRAVLLCFNENVRCAEDVFRCHNEFIRDTAHASGLQLSSSEWRVFFGKEAANAPYLWGNIGIPVPRVDNSAPVDALGMMTHSELAKFRTTWCSKRYDHDHELCGFAHVEIDGGWLRRNFMQHEYGTEICPDIIKFSSSRYQSKSYVVNACPRGVYCGYAHSNEEVSFHPRSYKSKICSAMGRPGGCPNGDVCHGFHPLESYKFPSKKGEGRLNARHRGQQGANTNKGTPASTMQEAPILYCSPAPVSRFEEQLQMPGLKNLYRRHCSVVRAHLRNPGSCVCCYSCFDDDNGTDMDPKKLQAKNYQQRGLPQPRRV